MFETLVKCLLLIVIVALIYFIFGLYAKGLTYVVMKVRKKQLASGKVNDKKVARGYKHFKKLKDRKILLVLFHGMFFSTVKRQYTELYEMYRNEMIKRGLPL